MGLCCSLFPLVLLKKKKKKRKEKSSGSSLFAFPLQEPITQWEQQFVALASATLLPSPFLPQTQQSGCSRQVPEEQEAHVACGHHRDLPAWGRLHMLCNTPSSRDILASRPCQLRHVPICPVLISGSFCPSQTQGQVCTGGCGGTLGCRQH